MGLRPAVTGPLTRQGARRGAEVTKRPAASMKAGGGIILGRSSKVLEDPLE